MKKVYFIDCDSNYCIGMLEHEINLLGSKNFATRKEAIATMLKMRDEAKVKFASEIACIKNHNKQFNKDCRVCIDCYLAEVEDDFDLENDSIFECDNHHIIDSRLLVGGYW